ncbi:MAG: RluA family pseudouridine synthase [Alphaproteobacteria bacterium]|nr:RluA family pseudouridine synthase [Alphaproteobacteria bacterium]
MGKVRHVEVKPDEDGQRLDRWLKKQLPKTPFGLLQKLIRTGQLRINGGRAKKDTKLEVGQTVRIPPVEVHDIASYKIRKGDKELMESLIVYDDGDLIVINKPYGIPSQGGSDIDVHIDGMLGVFENRRGVRPKLLHRLDKNTSGLLMCARELKTVQNMGRVLKDKNIRKYYWGFVNGIPDSNEGTIYGGIAKGKGRDRERMILDDEEGLRAHTEFSVIDNVGEDVSFMAFWPRSGRTHQIRVHAADALNCPILGDHKYGGREVEGFNLSDRLHLQAYRISFPNPNKKNHILDISIPIAEDLKKTCQALGFHPDKEFDPFADIEI